MKKQTINKILVCRDLSSKKIKLRNLAKVDPALVVTTIIDKVAMKIIFWHWKTSVEEKLVAHHPKNLTPRIFNNIKKNPLNWACSRHWIWDGIEVEQLLRKFFAGNLLIYCWLLAMEMINK